MVHYHRSKQDSSELNQLLPLAHPEYNKKSKPTLLTLLLLFSLFTFILIILFPTYSFISQVSTSDDQEAPACSFMPNNSICCDRSSTRTDLCYMRGDIRSDSRSNSLFLLSDNTKIEDQKIKPYTRKWEANTMSTIDELTLRATNTSIKSCDVYHSVPAVFFSTGGYTGNVYHEFNDGLIPLYITSRRFDRKVVFVILEYHDWWISKYENIISQLSDYPPIDFSRDRRTHCFSEAIVGLEIHDELTVDSSRMTDNGTIRDFRRLLDRSYKGRIEYIERVEEGNINVSKGLSEKPKLVIVSRNGSRGIENEEELVKVVEKVGFYVEVLRPERTTELAKIYRSLNSSDVMIGVHGAAMTHLLFMRHGSVFVQIVPLGTDWAAETYYGEPARKMGLKYVGYKILAKESSLYRKYAKDDPVLVEPDKVNERGWEVTKKVYLDGQNVILDLGRFRKRLVKAYDYVESRRGSRKFSRRRR